MRLNPLSWFRGADAPPEAKASAAGPIVSAWNVGRPVWTSRDYEKFADEAYVRNAVANRCVSLVAGGAAEAMGALLLSRRGGEEVAASPLLDLLSRPCPGMGRAQFFEALFSYLLLQGNAYVEAVGPERGAPQELWNLRPDRMKVVPGAFGMPQAFEYSHGGRTKRWDVNPMTGAGPILHVPEFHPTDDWYGLSRTEPAAYAVDRHNAASGHDKALLDNGARPSGALVFEPIKGSGGEGVSAPRAVIEDAEKALKDRHGGPGNAGKPMVLSGSVKWQEMGLSPKDMDFRESKLDAARDICEAFRVPSILIVPGQSTYNNVREAKLALYEEAVLPLAERVVTALNSWLAPRFGEGLTLSVDEDALPALEPRREARRKTAVDLLEGGVIDDTEAREMLGYGPRAQGSLRKVDASVISALLGVVLEVGVGPLVRYMQSVGLYDASMTEEQIIAEAERVRDAQEAETLP